ncbi:MAG: carboxynorspermidine decarboxylase [Gammaproteobacteria bacterium]|nr:MAG: carboxynorspermidine decarboxylase [Gammaproteobacteria bacterium]
MNLRDIETPCYVCDETRLRRNLELLGELQERTGCVVLLALKAFAMFSTFPLMRRYLAGTAASSLNEARLGSEEFGGQVHLCAPAYKDSEFDQLLAICDHIVFNSFRQWRHFKPRIEALARATRCGIRVNPEHSEVATPIYDACAPNSRLGVRRADFAADSLDGISGLHFHTLCGHDADALARTLQVFEKKFGEFLPAMEWVNFGGGHHIARDGYDLDGLCAAIDDFRSRHDVEVYLEPGEGVVMNAGVLVASVLDVLPNDTVILDASASAHMPDVLEMPYRVDIRDAGQPGELDHTYWLGGPTCMAGDVFGQYSFAQPLEVGARVVFEDMAPYTMVKNTMFNGVWLPRIAIEEAGTGRIREIRRFDYQDYRQRLS